MDSSTSMRFLEAKIARSRRFRLLKLKRSKQRNNIANLKSPISPSVHEEQFKRKKLGTPNQNKRLTSSSSHTLSCLAINQQPGGLSDGIVKGKYQFHSCKLYHLMIPYLLISVLFSFASRFNCCW
jgi:hypothetical protein